MNPLFRWRTSARLALRQLRRAPLAAVLISALIMLPVAGMTAFAIVGSSMIPNSEERVTVALGHMQAWIGVGGSAHPDVTQATDPDGDSYLLTAPSSPTSRTLADPTSVLPAGTEALRIVQSDVRVQTPSGTTGMRAWSGNTWDSRFAGRFDKIEGTVPSGDHEAMATPAALDRLRIGIGDTIVLPDTGGTYTVVGTMSAAPLAADVPALFVPPSTDLPGKARWYLPAHALAWDDIRALNEQGVAAYSRQVALDPPAQSEAGSFGLEPTESAESAALGMGLAAGGLFSGYVLLMLAGAAFAVSTRRQQRSLAVASSIGASPRDVRLVVLLQGTMLGVVGALAGLALGVGVAALTMSVADDGSATRFWGFHLPWHVLAAIFLLTVLVGTASATRPARTVSRDVLSTLRGARRTEAARSSRPWWGWGVLLLGAALTLGATIVVRNATISGDFADGRTQSLLSGAIIVGPVLVQLGFILSGRWILAFVSRSVARAGTSARIAARDASANASRIVPAFAAIAATVFIAVFAVGQVVMQNEDTVRTWGYVAPLDSLDMALIPAMDQLEAPGESDVAQASAEALEAAQQIAQNVDAVDSAVVAQQTRYWPIAQSPAPVDSDIVIALIPTHQLRDPDPTLPAIRGAQDRGNPISVITADDLDTALGVHLTAGQLDAYRHGAAIVTDPRFVTDDTITLGAWSPQDAADGSMPDNYTADADAYYPRTAPQWKKTIAAVTVDAPLQRVAIALSPSSADDLGIVALPTDLIVSFDGPADVETRDRVTRHAQDLSGSTWTIAPRFEDGPPDGTFWVLPVLTAVVILALGTAGIALSLARIERRPDDATLSAVGAGRGLRRRISMWQGLLIAGLGTLIGTLSGVLPSVGFGAESGTSLSVSNIPWALFAGLTVALPLLVALVSWLVPPRRVESTRRTAIT